MKIIVAGGGSVGEGVARTLGDSGNAVVIVEVDRKRASELEGRGLSVVSGNAAVVEVLEQAGALSCDVLVACTGLDEENLVISLLARRHLEIPRVVARVNDEANRWLFSDLWGVDAAISAELALVGLIEEATGSARTVRLADMGAVGLILVEANVTADSEVVGRAIGALGLSESDLAAAVIRGGRALACDDYLTLDVGDRVLIVTRPQREESIRRIFYPEADAAPR